MGENVKKSGIFFVLIILFLLAVSLTTLNTSSAATPLYVNGTSGNDSWDGMSPVYLNGTYGPMKTIQTAVNAVDTDGTVYVAEGTYNEHVTINKNLNLIGTNRDTTIIDGTNNGRTVWIDALSNVNIANFTIRNGTITNNGGGIYSLATLTINNCIITGNTANNNRGGGIYAAGTTTVNNSIITGNTALNGGGIAYGYNTITIRYSRLTGNTATNGREIYQYYASIIDAQYNWWGQNSGPQAGQIYGTVNYNLWLYMNLTTPGIIVNGSTGQLNASFNYAYNGTNVTAINPAMGHLPDGSSVTFTTDLGNVGSKTTNKSTVNGISTAILTANEGIGYANVSARLDSQNLTATIRIMDPVLYVNAATGNDTWDGSSPTWINGTTGPMKTIQTAINALPPNWTVIVAAGTYAEHLTVSKNLTITGAGSDQTILDGTNNGRVMVISASNYVTINQLTIRNGNNTLSGGGIYNAGVLTINNSTITNNTAMQGGGIYNYRGVLNINYSNLTGNTVSGGTPFGGAIFDSEGSVTLNNSTLSGNTAPSGGGAGALFENNGATNINNCIITGNSGGYGGALATISVTVIGGGVHPDHSPITIYNSIISNNTANQGGVIGNDGRLRIYNSTLTGNIAGTGSVIANSNGTVTMNYNRISGTGNLITNNLAPIFDAQNNWWGSNLNPSSQFAGYVNYTPWIYMTFNATPKLISQGATSLIAVNFNNVFNGTVITPINPAIGHLPDGSAVTFTTDFGSIGSKIIFKNTINGLVNATLTANEGPGIAFITAGMDNQIFNTTINIDTLFVNGATGNDAWDGTSPTYISGIVGPMKTIQTAINTVVSGGRVNVASGTYIERITINKNMLLYGAGQGLTFISGNNTGTVVTTNTGTNVTIIGVTIKNGNGTLSWGGGIFNRGIMNLINTTITNNTADAGGAIQNYFGSLTINGCNLTNNTARVAGAIFNTDNASVTIINTKITGNTASQSSGAINTGGTGTLNITGCNITGNTAATDGGALVTAGNVTITNTTINNNSANNGGGLVNYGILTITGSTISGNTAVYNGGGIYNSYFTTLTVNYCRIFNNSANDLISNEIADVRYNWWGSNSDPSSHITGAANYSPWIYMNLTANGTLISNGATSTLTAGLNNLFDGVTVTPLNPAMGHIPDGNQIIFTTDLGNVGSKTTIKTTTNGLATAMLTADEGRGTAHISAQLDNQIVNSTVGIETLYVNAATGNDTWDGTSPIWVSGTAGPMKTIQTAVNTINNGYRVYVASGTYYELITINRSMNLFGTGPGLTIIDGNFTGTVVTINNGVNVNLTGVTIQRGSATSGGGILNSGVLNITNSIITGNNALTAGAGILSFGNLIVNSVNITDNVAGNHGGAIYGATNCNLNITNCNLTNNTALSGGAIYCWAPNQIIVNYNRIINNSTIEIQLAGNGAVDARYNWWGSNTNPSSKFAGTVITYSPWIYMVFSTNPRLILNGGTSVLTANFNNVYNGSIITPINPANGHIPDGVPITFTTDLGSVGSKNITKNVTNGVSTATLTADEGTGTAHISALVDNQLSNITVGIETMYVNGSTGNDSYDGTSPVYISGVVGPMKTIQTAINAINIGGTVNVAAGTYTELLNINKNLNLYGSGQGLSIINGNGAGTVIVNGAGTNVNITGFTIQNGASSNGAGVNNAGSLNLTNSTITQNTATTNGGGVYNSGTMGVINCIITLNTASANGGGIYSLGILNVTNSTITQNTATTNGGGILNFGVLTVNGSTIIQNTATANGGGIYNTGSNSWVYYSRISGNSVRDIYTTQPLDGRYNWWGQNAGPVAGQITGTVTTNPWLYMTFNANPALVYNGSTSQLNASFNSVYNGVTVTPIDPANGHLPEGSPVTFTTNLGSVGSKTTTKNTTNGIATATLTADESPGTANLSAQLDNQLLNLNVIIKAVRYVNGVTGNDSWDGSSSTWISGLIGPMKTIQVAVNSIESNGTVVVATGTYLENVVLDKLVQIINGGSGVVNVHASNTGLPVFLVNTGGSGTTIQGLNITGGSTGIYLNGAGNCNITGNNLTGNSWSGIGISGAQGTVVNGNMVSGNQEGIYILNGSTNNTIMGNIISGNQFSGVCVDTSYNTNISGNGLISGNSNGIRLYHATGNLILGNNLAANLWCAIVLDGSSNNQIISGNTLTNNVEGIHLMNNANNNFINGTNITGNSSSWCGISVWNSTGNNLTNNTVTGKQEGIYLTQGASYNIVGQNNIHDNLNSAICMDQNSQYNTIMNNINITMNGNGIRLYQALQNTVTLNTITQSVWAAICLDNSSNNTVSWNTVSSNQEGIYVFNNANNNAIINNTATSNAYSGICFNNAVNNTLNWNTITGNGNGIRLYNYANLNNVTHNNVTGQGWAGMVIDNSYQNQVHFNTVGSNGEGLYSMNGSSNNQIFQNNFVNNTNHNAYDDGVNSYDDGVGTGNYWSDYSGSGTYAVPGGGNMDNYPSLTQF
jgi:parallel beta-helix repeat protein